MHMHVCMCMHMNMCMYVTPTSRAAYFGLNHPQTRVKALKGS